MESNKSTCKIKTENNCLKNDFEEFLDSKLFKAESFHPHFTEAYRRMLKVGGKRFRPLLLLSIVKVANPLFLKSAMYGALAIEMVHTYSLIHDDLPSMDNSPLRRGHATLHVSYDETTAVLIGDALNTDAFLMLTQAPLDDKTKVRLVEVLSKNAGSFGMVLGQAIDCYFENIKLNEEELSFLHMNKTGKLIATSLQMGAIISNLNQEVEERLYKFGLNLGLLFQINDDIIDATQTSFEAGKPTHHDKNKNSYVNLFGLKKAEELKEKMKKELQEDLSKFDEKIAEGLKKLLTKYIN